MRGHDRHPTGAAGGGSEASAAGGRLRLAASLPAAPQSERPLDSLTDPFA